MNPATRTLVRVTLPDVIAADHMFSMLMGEEVEPRRRFIEEHALEVRNREGMQAFWLASQIDLGTAP
jgi:DNA gyrase subunit B